MDKEVREVLLRTIKNCSEFTDDLNRKDVDSMYLDLSIAISVEDSTKLLTCGYTLREAISLMLVDSDIFTFEELINNPEKVIHSYMFNEKAAYITPPIVILKNIKTIKGNAFLKNQGIEELDLIYCHAIGSAAFSECDNLKTINILFTSGTDLVIQNSFQYNDINEINIYGFDCDVNTLDITDDTFLNNQSIITVNIYNSNDKSYNSLVKLFEGLDCKFNILRK